MVIRPELDKFWNQLKNQSHKNWYIYDLNEQPQEKSVACSEFHSFIKHIDSFLRSTHKEDYCGVVYVDDITTPSYIKIFHPKRMGFGVCSLIKEAPLPGWVLSTIKPTDLNPKPPESVSWLKKFSFHHNKV